MLTLSRKQLQPNINMDPSDYDNKNPAGYVNPRHNKPRTQKVSPLIVSIHSHFTLEEVAAGRW